MVGAFGDANMANWRGWTVPGIAVVSAIVLSGVDPIAQSPGYHQFADDRTMLGLPHALDVLSNLAFLVVGLIGLRNCVRYAGGPARVSWFAMFSGVTLVSAGSAYYHWEPGNWTLVWDRLPMTIGFTGLFVALLCEFINPRLARWLPLALILGGATVFYWYYFDDLRPYAWVQFVPLLSIPLLVALYPARYTHGWMLVTGLGFYALAKVAEHFDEAIYAAIQVGGHTIKHLLAAVACWVLADMLRRRQPRVGTAPGATR